MRESRSPFPRRPRDAPGGCSRVAERSVAQLFGKESMRLLMEVGRLRTRGSNSMVCSEHVLQTVSSVLLPSAVHCFFHLPRYLVEGTLRLYQTQFGKPSEALFCLLFTRQQHSLAREGKRAGLLSAELGKQAVLLRRGLAGIWGERVHNKHDGCNIHLNWAGGDANHVL